MDQDEICSIVESLIFIVEKPVTLAKLVELTGEKTSSIEKVLEKIQQHYSERSRGICLVNVGEGFQFRTPRENAPWVQKAVLQKPVRLSAANIEVLSIVAYKQPVTRSEVDSIRGVDSSHILKTLMEKKLVQMDGKTDDPGRPILYSTTLEFLEFFSLKSIRDLPTLRDLEELFAFGDDENMTNLPKAVRDMLNEKENKQKAKSAPPPPTREVAENP